MEASALHAPAAASAASRSAAPLLRLRSDEQLRRAVPRRQRRGLPGPPRPLPPAPVRLRAPDAVRRLAPGRRGRAAGRLRARLRRAAQRQPRDERARVALPRRPQPLHRPSAPARPARRPRSSRSRASRCTTRSRRPSAATTCAGSSPTSADLPEQQRSALLMREIDGMTYADLAAALDVTVPAVKSLLVRARVGLVEAAEARDADCSEIRADLMRSYDRGVKASGRARKHMRSCDGCREYRARAARHAALVRRAHAGRRRARSRWSPSCSALGGAAAAPPRAARPPAAARGRGRRRHARRRRPARSPPSSAPPRSPPAAPSRSASSRRARAPARRAPTPPATPAHARPPRPRPRSRRRAGRRGRAPRAAAVAHRRAAPTPAAERDAAARRGRPEPRRRASSRSDRAPPPRRGRAADRRPTSAPVAPAPDAAATRGAAAAPRAAVPDGHRRRRRRRPARRGRRRRRPRARPPPATARRRRAGRAPRRGLDGGSPHRQRPARRAAARRRAHGGVARLAGHRPLPRDPRPRDAARPPRPRAPACYTIVAVHSTARGPALGGCRMWTYDDSRAAVRDALRLSRAMTFKSAVAGLPLGGGKGVIMLRRGRAARSTPRAPRRAAADFGDTVDPLGGALPDRRGRRHVRRATWRSSPSAPSTSPGSRSSAAAPAIRARGPRSACEAAMRVTCERVFGTDDLAGRSVAVIGLGQRRRPAGRDARRGGARRSSSPTSTRASASSPSELGADWTDPQTALTAEVDVLAPCALGGVLDDDTVPALRCRAIAGAANNQLAADDIADAAAPRAASSGRPTSSPTPAGSSTSASSSSPRATTPTARDAGVRASATRCARSSTRPTTRRRRRSPRRWRSRCGGSRPPVEPLARDAR